MWSPWSVFQINRNLDINISVSIITGVRHKDFRLLFLPRCIYAGRSYPWAKWLSVRLSIKCVNFIKTKETYAKFLIPYKRSFFWQAVWLMWYDPFYLKYWANPFASKTIFDLQCISSAVTASEKSSIMTNRKPYTGWPKNGRVFLVRLNFIKY